MPASVLLGICVCVLPLVGSWIVATFQLPKRISWAMWCTAALTCLAWAWQRAFFLRLVPNHELTYGHFLTQAGAVTRVYILQGPLNVVALLGVMLFCGSVVHAWRAGARWSVAPLALWWVASYLTFGVPAFYLWGQGDAAIFI